MILKKIKIVFGETAAAMHNDGRRDSEVKEWGSIESFTFATQAELDAFLLGLAVMDGWMGYTVYNSDP